MGQGLPTLLVAMLGRDEEALLRKHLPAWKQVGDAFLLGLDARTQDDSAGAARSVLEAKPLQVYHFDFDGFGAAKSRLLQESHARFPDMTYVLLVEPDMRPKVETFSREPLKDKEPVYAIRRGGKESLGERLTDCVFRNDGRWYFRFRVHETPVYRNSEKQGLPEQIKDTGWSVVEIEGSARDAASRQHRIREELRLVRLDLQDHPGHPRLLYYLGVLQYDLAVEIKAAGATSLEDVRELATK
ncbi:Cyb5d2, partial [Symbiodinium natans]